MKKRIISLLICIVMLVSVLPMSVFAAKQPAALKSETFHISAADTDIPDNDELFAGYVDKMFSGSISSSAAYGTLAREKLNAKAKVVYDGLKPGIVSVANGEAAYTTFELDDSSISNVAKTTWTLSELGYSSVSESAINAAFEEYWNQFDMDAIFYALLNDFPYELYWFDKTEGLYWWAYYDYSDTEIYIYGLTFSFSVSEDYQSYNYDPDDPSVDTDLTGATAASVANAKAIVNEYAALDDYNKLLAYNNEIMDLVDYNHDAIDYDYAYGDPWQLVYVFDGDSSTDVVCEGYSKAFQYLCDLSDFDADIRCYSVTGGMGFVEYGEGEAHMWNTVTMEDGKNYLVDVTNSEPGSVGENGEFFLAGASGSIDNFYTVNASGSELFFKYDLETIATWGSGSDSPLYLAGTSYTPQEHKHVYNAFVYEPTCTEGGITTYICETCGDTYNADEVPALGHDEVTIAGVPATCTEDGLTEGSHCSRCDEIFVKQEIIPALGHSWDEGVVTVEPTEEADGEMLFTCTACGETRTESIALDGHIHNYNTFAGVLEPSCELPGGDIYACDYEGCNKGTIKNEVPALGHSWGEWVIIDEPTETAEGIREHTCTVCDETEIDYFYMNPFVDVDEGDYYYDPVTWAAAKGITAGVDETHFAPNNTCTRAQVVTFLWRANGQPEPTSQEHSFTDIDAGAYYYDAVLWAVENGITTGMTDTTFNPDGACTRAQVATFLWRANGQPEPTSQEHPFTDLEEGAYYYDAVLWAVEYGITNGMTATTFEPNTTCTRGQIVTFLYRAYA